MHRGADREYLFAVDAVAELVVERDIVGEALVGIEPDLGEASRDGQLLGQRHQPASEAAALKGRIDCYILDQQVIGLRKRLDQRRQRAVDIQEIETMVADGGLV